MPHAAGGVLRRGPPAALDLIKLVTEVLLLGWLISAVGTSVFNLMRISIAPRPHTTMAECPEDPPIYHRRGGSGKGGLSAYLATLSDDYDVLLSTQIF